MKTTAALAAIVVICVSAQVLIPGQALYHRGWYDVALAALAIWTIMRTRRAPVIAFGIGALAFAGVASGLLGPDSRTVIGAPGTHVNVPDIGGTLAFPLAQALKPRMYLIKRTTRFAKCLLPFPIWPN